ncbi:PH domain-containing protein [Amycolatopsis nigrescens]|uniref:PH domain-containing protein n=1 Tax=Amycolatopsis nigrescens TaxID=381445 RepID=UPI00037DB544|nr:PH domain-containing protein [Amycolatopsis nigrescens]
MDNYPARWAPRPAVLAVGWLLAGSLAAGATIAALSGDLPGAVLFGAGAVVLAVAAGFGTLLRPRLAAGQDGIRVRTVNGVHELAWHEVRVRLAGTRRLGRDSSTLELDADERFFVLGRLDLGEDPREVLDVLTALRAGRL